MRPYAAVGGGIERRQTVLDGEQPANNSSGGRDRWDKSFVVSLAAGLEMPVAPLFFAGVEFSGSKSANNTAGLRERTIVRIVRPPLVVTDLVTTDPHWSFAFTGRLGVRVTRQADIYALGGLGVDRTRVGIGPPDAASGGVQPVYENRTFEGIAFGGGARLYLTTHVGLRVEYRRLETDDAFDPEQVTAGLLYRF